MGKYITALLLLSGTLLMSSTLTYDYGKTGQSLSSSHGFSALEIPALISRVGHHIGYSHQEKLSSKWSINQFKAVVPMGKSTVGFHMNVESLGSLAKTTIDNSGVFQTASTYSHTKISAIFTVGKKNLFNHIDVGLNWKQYYQKIESKSMYASGFDLGASYRVTPQLFFGGTITNIGSTSFKWNDNITDTLAQDMLIQASFSSSIGFISMDHSVLKNRETVRLGATLLDTISIVGKVPLDNIGNSDLQFKVKVDQLEFGYTMEFNEAFGPNSKAYLTMEL
jgi:hypothetical protein